MGEWLEPRMGSSVANARIVEVPSVGYTLSERKHTDTIVMTVTFDNDMSHLPSFVERFAVAIGNPSDSFDELS